MRNEIFTFSIENMSSVVHVVNKNLFVKDKDSEILFGDFTIVSCVSDKIIFKYVYVIKMKWKPVFKSVTALDCLILAKLHFADLFNNYLFVFLYYY